MRKKLWVNLAVLLLVSGLIFVTGCAKKTIKSETSMQQAEEEAAMKARAAEKAKQEEMARQQREKAVQEASLREEAQRKMMAAKEMFLNEDIHFEFDSSALLSDAQEILQKKAEWLRNNTNVRVVIEGYCDERGTNEYNLALGERRAASAKAYLTDLGISGSRLTTISYGEERPLDSGHNEEAWSKNRRTHFTID